MIRQQCDRCGRTKAANGFLADDAGRLGTTCRACINAQRAEPLDIHTDSARHAYRIAVSRKWTTT